MCDPRPQGGGCKEIDSTAVTVAVTAIGVATMVMMMGIAGMVLAMQVAPVLMVPRG